MPRKALLLTFLLGAVGCGSMKTTVLDRTEHDALVVNPHHPICGVPVMLRVPTHLSVAIHEKRFWKVDDSASLVPVSACRPVLEVDHQLEYTAKLFVVDPVKPLSGSQEYGFSFRTANATSGVVDGQLETLRYKSVDTSINDVAALVGTAMQRFAPPAAPSSGTESPPTQVVTTTRRVIAFRRFDINSPAFEAEVTGFLACNLNGQHHALDCELAACKSCEECNTSAPATAVNPVAPAAPPAAEQPKPSAIVPLPAVKGEFTITFPDPSGPAGEAPASPTPAATPSATSDPAKSSNNRK